MAKLTRPSMLEMMAAYNEAEQNYYNQLKGLLCDLVQAKQDLECRVAVLEKHVAVLEDSATPAEKICRLGRLSGITIELRGEKDANDSDAH